MKKPLFQLLPASRALILPMMKKPLLSSCLLLLLLTCLRCSSAQLSIRCSSADYTTESGYGDSLMDLATALRNASSRSLYRNATSSAAYGMFQCRGDATQQDCSVCVDASLDMAMNQNCSTRIGANIQLDYCHVRYDNDSALFDGTRPDMGYWFTLLNTAKNNDSAFQNDVKTALVNVTGSTPYNPNYYASTQQGFVYALAQCDGYLSEYQCRSCLSPVSDIAILNNAKGGRIYYGSCFYHYEAYLFYSILSPPPAFPSPTSNPPSPNSSKNSSSIPIGAVAGGSVGAIVLSGLLIFGLLFYCRRKKTSLHIQGTLSDEGRQHVFVDPVITNFSYEELKEATRDFHLDNKIGAGGFGPVYKGTLVNGLEVAIKKLSANSNQGKREFMNEVSVITSVQHRNLIKLHGCCVEGSERLLVYEYLPNKSLDNFIFDQDLGNNVVKMDWITRMNVIVGTARGLAYLHEDSQVRIIHRDIKASNILLDENLAPKIADFGLAKLFSHDASHVTTRVAGTLGYLSPEYALLGQLTEKADVYSFGVLTLEIISGRRNADFQQPEKQRLVDWAWVCYLEGSQMQLLDPKLGTMKLNPPMEEVIRVIHVALLCLQSSSLERPSMTKVVQLLAGQFDILERPEMPHYIQNNPMDATNATRFETDASENSRGRLIPNTLLHNNPSLYSEQVSTTDVSAR